MARRDDASDTPVQLTLAELMAGYLQRRAEAQAAGLVSAETGEVVPFEAAPVQAVDPRLAWDEAVAAVRQFADKVSLKAPPDWPLLVTSHEPTVALAFAAANFPQLVRHFQPLLHSADLTGLRPTGSRPVAAAALLNWAPQQKQFPQALLAVGALRLARQFDAAAALISERRGVPAEWQVAWANEQAALAWHSGRAEEAAAMWDAQADSVPVLFNRGMAALFLGRRTAAREPLSRAVAQLPETGAWHHLGRLYLALAEMRG